MNLNRELPLPRCAEWVIPHAGAEREIERLDSYLPNNYGIAATIWGADTVTVLIAGIDVAGWTMDAYVKDRLASGSIYVNEVALAQGVAVD